ncbi:unnamed protein product [Symbiodinium sp. CCMP2456]|nr:unnamed protein product [Symbiodinium sp. CCMP2456]
MPHVSHRDMFLRSGSGAYATLATAGRLPTVQVCKTDQKLRVGELSLRGDILALAVVPASHGNARRALEAPAVTATSVSCSQSRPMSLCRIRPVRQLVFQMSLSTVFWCDQTWQEDV